MARSRVTFQRERWTGVFGYVLIANFKRVWLSHASTGQGVTLSLLEVLSHWQACPNVGTGHLIKKRSFAKGRNRPEVCLKSAPDEPVRFLCSPKNHVVTPKAKLESKIQGQPGGNPCERPADVEKTKLFLQVRSEIIMFREAVALRRHTDIPRRLGLVLPNLLTSKLRFCNTRSFPLQIQCENSL